MNRDLTVGRADKVLWAFCLPLFCSVIFQQLYNIADSLVAGKFIGSDALAAVGNSYEITLIFIAFAFGCNIGCSVVVSQFFGHREYRDMKTAVYTTLISSGVLCLLLMAIGLVFSTDLLLLINTPENVLEDSRVYLQIYCLSLPFVFYYNVANGIFSALGDSRTPFIFLACSSVSNIAVDILFVAVLNLGVAGVAWATLLCQGVSCVLAVFFVFRRFNRIETDGRPKMFSFPLLRRIAVIAIPSILQQSCISIGNILIQSVINSFGSAVMAGYSAAIKLNNMVITAFTTLGNGVSNFTAQNRGAGKTERLKEGFRAGVKLVWILCVPIVLLYFFGGGILLRLFLDSSSVEALDTAMLFLHIVAPFYFVVSVKLVADGILRGSELMGCFMISTFTDLVLRVGLTMILSRPFGPAGIWMSWPVGWICGTAVSCFFYWRTQYNIKLG